MIHIHARTETMAISPETEEEMKVAYRALWAEAAALGASIQYQFCENPADSLCFVHYPDYPDNETPCIDLRRRYVPPCVDKVDNPADTTELFELASAVAWIKIRAALPQKAILALARVNVVLTLETGEITPEAVKSIAAQTLPLEARRLLFHRRTQPDRDAAKYIPEKILPLYRRWLSDRIRTCKADCGFD